MKLTKLNSKKIVYVNFDKYKIDWERKVSNPQFSCKQFLKDYWLNDVVFEEACIPGSKYRIDLWNETKSLIVEVSPESVHTKYNTFIHKNRSGFYKKLTSDVEKEDWANENGYKYISLNDKDIKNLSRKYVYEKFGINL